ncbi:MAG: prepilin-type N-terminal cleavage/methylation domain-containing protein [Thermodesulfovibrionales bacterium]|nr:prepilin-type N-terminal cleavage/methylation domain-containing protein [Thermodesulfovibrionales bacterium]
MGPLRTSRGFTLLEVMVALAIVAGLLVTLLYTVSQHLEVAERHEVVTKGVLLAREKLAEVRAGTRKAEGRFAPPDEDYQWRVDVEQKLYFGVTVYNLSVTVTRGRERVVLSELMREGVFAQ